MYLALNLMDKCFYYEQKKLKHEINRSLFHKKVIGDYYHMTTMNENVY